MITKITPFTKPNNIELRIKELESFLKLPLPYEYKRYLLENEVGIFNENLNFTSQDTLQSPDNFVYQIESLFGFIDNSSDQENDLLFINKKYRNQIPSDMMLIGKVKNSNSYIAVTLSLPSDRIYLWDHDRLDHIDTLVKLNEEYSHITNSFELKTNGVVYNSFKYLADNISQFMNFCTNS